LLARAAAAVTIHNYVTVYNSGVWDTGLSGQGTGTTNQPASHPPADSPLTASSPLGTRTGTGGGEEDQSVSESGLNLISEIIIYV